MNREQILAQVRRTAEANGNPVGERAFFTDTGLTRRALWRAGFPNYGSAVEAAGYRRNELLKEAYSDDRLFAPLATLTRDLGHFPTEAERFVARHKYAGFPGAAAYRRRAKVEPLAQALLGWCRRSELFRDVAELLESSLAKHPGADSSKGGRKVVTGYVYLMKYGVHGKDFKIGSTENVGRRESQIDMMSPSDVRVVHSIETDDPKGIEMYWHERFAARRVKTKEVFRLTPEDVAAFKRRRYQSEQPGR
jgi:hypothetical protein